MTVEEFLSNPIIQKYFGCGDPTCDRHGRDACRAGEAYRVLSAMYEPIKQSEEYIALSVGRVIGVMSGTARDTFHPHDLRLPSQFQEKKCDHDGYLKCVNCGINWTDGHEVVERNKPDPVEKKIEEIAKFYDDVRYEGWPTSPWIKMKMTELIALARETK